MERIKREFSVACVQAVSAGALLGFFTKWQGCNNRSGGAVLASLARGMSPQLATSAQSPGALAPGLASLAVGFGRRLFLV